MATVEKVLTLARKELGYRESPPKSNRTKYGKWFKLDGNPWCMMFVMWIFHQAEALPLLPVRTASCNAFMKAAKKAKNWHKKSDLKPGDVVIFDFPGNLSATDHVGIVEELPDDVNYVFTIEGNTSTSDQSNGGVVMRRKRKRSLIAGAFRPAYEAEEAETPEPVPEPESAKETQETEPECVKDGPDPDSEQRLYGEMEPEAGETVTFKGNSQFSSPYDDAEAVPATACTAQVIACSRGAAHPFRLSGTGVEGWTDFEDVKLLSPEAKRAELAHAAPKTGFRVEITARPSLRVRNGPGIEYPHQESLSAGTVVTILEERNGWGRFSGESWISLKYTKNI
ncbi:MAG: CHAP domain-containing protein [Oscillibacter sp.]|nr:CHAP domain-containing protein [Oscillibacter sp.]